MAGVHQSHHPSQNCHGKAALARASPGTKWCSQGVWEPLPRPLDSDSKLTFHLWGENLIFSLLHHTNNSIYYFPGESIRKFSMCSFLASITFLDYLSHSNANLEFWIWILLRRGGGMRGKSVPRLDIKPCNVQPGQAYVLFGFVP